MKFLVAALLLLSCVRSEKDYLKNEILQETTEEEINPTEMQEEFDDQMLRKIWEVVNANHEDIEDLNFSKDEMLQQISKLVNTNAVKIKDIIKTKEEREKLIHIWEKAQDNSATIESIRQKTEEIQGRVLEEATKEGSKNINQIKESILIKMAKEEQAQKKQVQETEQKKHEITKEEVNERTEKEVQETCDNGNWSRTGYAPCTPHTVCRGPVQTDGSSTSDVECVKYKEINATGAEAACMPMGGVSIEDCYKHCGFRHNHPDIWPKFFVYGTNKLKNNYCWCVPNRRHLMPNENDEAAKCKDQEISAQYQLSEKITYYEIVNHKGMPKKSIDAGNM